MHIHVYHSNGEAKFWLEPAIELAQNYGLSAQGLREIESLVRLHEQEIKNAWRRYFSN